MRQIKKQFGLETLERREVFTGVTGVEGFNIYDAPLNYNDNADVQQLCDNQVIECKLIDMQLQYRERDYVAWSGELEVTRGA